MLVSRFCSVKAEIPFYIQTIETKLSQTPRNVASRFSFEIGLVTKQKNKSSSHDWLHYLHNGLVLHDVFFL